MSPVVVLESVDKDYRAAGEIVRALSGVSFAVQGGEFVAITGPSGSGKSTLLNILGCLDRPTRGRYMVDGIDVSRADQRKLADVRNRRLGFVFQQFHLLPRMSAQENVELPLVYAGVALGERRRRARTALDRVGLAGRAGHSPNQLSGGQQQRVAIARAIASLPALLLADEPTGNLDSRTSHDVMGLLSELCAQGMTLVLVTHEQDIAAYARRTIVVHDGTVASDSAP